MSLTRTMLTGAAVPGDEPFDVLAWVTTNWWVIVAVIAWCVIGFAWHRLRVWAANTRGRALRPLHQLLYLVVRFILWDDRGPVITRPAKIAQRVRFIRWNLTYLAGTVATIILGWTGHSNTAAYLLTVLVALILVRAVRTFRNRWATLQQMFAVAATDLRYPKGANTTPWSYVKITRWDNLTRPGPTVITVPPGVPSESARTRDKFEENWKGTVTNAHGWQFGWESHNNRILATPQPLLPTQVAYPLPDPHPWHVFPLGDAGGGNIATWDVTVAPHILVAGPTGSGKSVLQRNILLHALTSPTWRVLGVDPKKVELGWLRPLPGVLKISTDLFDSVDLVEDVEQEMNRRYAEMEKLGENHFLDMPEPPPALLLMVDEVFAFLSPEGIKSDEGKERDEAHARASILIGSIARLGRAAGVHLALATQRPDATVLKGEVKNNLDARVAAGRMDTTPSLMVLDSEEANRLPGIRGRGLFRMGNELTEFQGYFLTREEVEAEIKRASEANEAQGADVGEDTEAASAQASRGKGLLGRFRTARAASVRGDVDDPVEVEKAEAVAAPDDERGSVHDRKVLGRFRRRKAASEASEPGSDVPLGEDGGSGPLPESVEVGDSPVEVAPVPAEDPPAAGAEPAPVPVPVVDPEFAPDPTVAVEPAPATSGGVSRPGSQPDGVSRPGRATGGVSRPGTSAPVAEPSDQPTTEPPETTQRSRGGDGVAGDGVAGDGVAAASQVADPFSVPADAEMTPAGMPGTPAKMGGGWPAPPKRDELPEPDADAVVDPFAPWPPSR